VTLPGARPPRVDQWALAPLIEADEAETRVDRCAVTQDPSLTGNCFVPVMTWRKPWLGGVPCNSPKRVKLPRLAFAALLNEGYLQGYGASRTFGVRAPLRAISTWHRSIVDLNGPIRAQPDRAEVRSMRSPEAGIINGDATFDPRAFNAEQGRPPLCSPDMR